MPAWPQQHRYKPRPEARGPFVTSSKKLGRIHIGNRNTVTATPYMDTQVSADTMLSNGNDNPVVLKVFDLDEEPFIGSLDENNILSFRSCTSKVFGTNLCRAFSSTTANEARYLLRDVCGLVPGGTDLAIMGPSGAGKSTLLNLLTLMPSNSQITGEVRLNGHPLTDAIFKRHCAYVPQEDHLWPFLTCRETIEFAADFYRQLPPAERRSCVDSLLSDLGLESCQHTRCGNQFIHGLSGGQKRRLSLAVALVKRPAVLFLDELTSGLDSHAAAEIMAVVRRIARASCIAVVCTIHQVRSVRPVSSLSVYPSSLRPSRLPSLFPLSLAPFLAASLPSSLAALPPPSLSPAPSSSLFLRPSRTPP